MLKGCIADIERAATHDGPGLRTTVFFKGCPLSCRWCHNPECISFKPEIMAYPEKCIGCGKCNDGCFSGARIICGKEMTSEEVLKEILLDKDYYGDNGRIKFGINNEHGFAMYFNHGDMFLKEFDVVIDGNYPDGGMCFETYTNPLFLEMESLGELKSVRAGETISHTEKWSLYKQDIPNLVDSDIDKLKEKYIDNEVREKMLNL